MKYIIKGKTFYDEVSYLVNETKYQVNNDYTISIFKGSYGWAPRGIDADGHRVFFKMIVDEDFKIPADANIEIDDLAGLSLLPSGKYCQWRNGTDREQPFYTGNLKSTYNNYAFQYDMKTNLIVGGSQRITDIGDLKNVCLPSFFIRYHVNKAPEVYPIQKILVDPSIIDVKSVFWLGRHEPEVLMRSK